MRIAIDLQACQTESRLRGIGRYARGFVRAVVARPGDAEFLLGLDATYPDAAVDLREEFSSLVPPAAFRPYFYPGPEMPVGAPGDGLRPAAETLIRRAYAEIGADVVHVSSLFEGFIEHAGGLGRLAHLPGTVSSLLMHDLIPLVMPQWYLQDEVFRTWYLARISQATRFDLLLCNSNATRRDVIDRLHIPSSRVVTVHAGVDEALLSLTGDSALPEPLRQRFGIVGRYVLYTGNGDPRKNLRGAVEAFAALPEALREQTQLVLNQVGDPSVIRDLVRAAGLAPDRVVVTGHVQDQELVALLRGCEVFFFPSLYEGFGLPVLEAMACGVPAICGDNSSLPEVVGRVDALFDASSVESAAAKLAQTLSDTGFRSSLARHGVERAREFTWDRSARLATEAWANAAERRRERISVAIAEAPRLKVALVTPLPPERTGIADYVMELLPALRARMDIDLYTTAPLEALKGEPELHFARPWTELAARANQYDQVIYQVGNSPFHSHMLELLEHVPGVVVLHDFFLSSLLAYLDRIEGWKGLFAAELERSHGRTACQNLNEEAGWLEAVRRWPASRRIFDHADAVIVHSAHAAGLVRSFYPAVAAAPVLHVPMPQAARVVDDARRQAARRSLAIDDGVCLVVSFGFLADTKLNLEVLDAFAEPTLRERNIRLVFVGEPDGGAYGQACRDRIEQHPLRDRIRITGFASSEEYETYLRAADIAVQLRGKSRGETSKSVLDCMSHGVAVIVNDYASFAELPDTAVVKLPAVPTPIDIASRILSLVDTPVERGAQGSAGYGYVARFHAPEVAAAYYESATRRSIEQRREANGERVADALAAAIAEASDAAQAASAVEHALHVAATYRAPMLFVDISDVVQQDHGTGIHRVVRNLTRQLVLHEGPGLRCLPVALDTEARLAPAEDYAQSRLRLPASHCSAAFQPAAGDVLFLLDSSWSAPERFLPSIDAMRNAGGRCVAMVYDLIPLRYPGYCAEFMPAVFEAWLRFVALHCDGLICISRAVADDVAHWIRTEGVAHRPRLRIGHVPLGCDIVEFGGGAAAIASAVEDAMGARGQAVLMVGTLEPRKRHDLVLDAFDRLWQEGDPRTLVIIGKRGWNVDALVRRIHAHPRFGTQLFWLQGLSDADITYAYRTAERVVQASDAEGFGLPLIEAAALGAPVLASDLPVFREVAAAETDFFTPGSADDLLRALRLPPQSPGQPTLTSWAESAVATRERLWAGPWDHELP
ncbi:glycosyltransferase [Cognatilysobacter bugurensis]|uniref:Mannosyltransferase A n=1 Tax=Cognatilysobacter bugurensis TaxID=543356 RepID=A0A918W9Q1_9GAMM|nr:glycosyltransferase [Lysobacter bugurensis]GHA85663.1 mannosyltransferase A [Lysobacter bugurensis]